MRQSVSLRKHHGTIFSVISSEIFTAKDSLHGSFGREPQKGSKIHPFWIHSILNSLRFTSIKQQKNSVKTSDSYPRECHSDRKDMKNSRLKITFEERTISRVRYIAAPLDASRKVPK